MPAIEIRPFAVREAVRLMQQAVSSKHFNYGEILMASAELIGRTVVEVAPTPPDAATTLPPVLDHIQRSLQVGYEAKGFNVTREVADE